MARNLDIQEAQQRVEASRGEYESSVGAIFPSITPNITGRGLEGALANPSGGVALATFRNFTPAAVINWIINGKPFDGDPEGAGVARMATVGPQCGVRNDYG